MSRRARPACPRPRRTGLVVAGLVLLLVVGIGAVARNHSTKSFSTAPTAAKHHKKQQERPHRHQRHKQLQLRQNLPPVPQLIGLTPAEVRQTLDPLGIQTHFYGHCEGRPPLGHVITQWPKAGHRPHLTAHWHGPDPVAADLSTDVTSSCSDGRAAKSCDPAQLRLTANGSASYYAGSAGKWLEYFDLVNRSTRPCQLRARASLTMTSFADGSLAPVRGNPASLVIDTKLQPDEDFSPQWIWESWCEPHHQWRLTVTVAGLSATGDTASPACLERGPSILRGA